MKPKIISTNQLAKICGVSQGTVDRALNDRPGISPKTKEKILSAAKAYGYRPNIHARSISGGRSMLLGVVVFDLQNEYFSDVLTRLEEACREKGYSTVVMFTHKDPEKERGCIESLYRMYMDGIVLCPINRGTEFENYLHSLEIPIVTVGNRLETFPYIGIDNFAAMEQAAEYAIGKGCRRLIYVQPVLAEGHNAYAQEKRLRGFRAAAERHGIDCSTVRWQEVPGLPVTAEKTALICPTDLYALRLLPTAKERGWGILGFDNVSMIDNLGLVLDSVAYDTAAVAEAVADFLESGTAKDMLVAHRYISRGSV